MRIVIALTLTSLALLLPAIAAGQEWRTITSSRAMSGEDLLHVDLEYGEGSGQKCSATKCGDAAGLPLNCPSY
jgi:hypothetical protein